MQEFTKFFIEYSESFLTGNAAEDQMIILKRDHCTAVSGLALELMQSVSACPADWRAAELGGLLHDIGRFRQYRQYRTFSDARSENHAKLSVEVIEELKITEKLPPQEQRMILKTVARHNLPKLPAEPETRQRLLDQVVRDADKIDIYNIVLDYYERPELHQSVALDLPDLPQISDEVIAALSAKQSVNMRALATLNDFKLCQLAWVYDLNLFRSRRIFAERNYIERMCKLIPDFSGFGNIRKQLNDFLNGDDSQ
ncbi:MAG: HD domain-containing protein [Lentisphaerae bacterium]|jgi:putative nucleotidyltransferase with HDIG domain|nr:HD domain-containing protein [Victivallaceae bacterium]MDD3116509.1 HD domain-containing protein [Victivallaceae bacterium]MDD3704191.1 HD domain-containing protein [Victivallaceae bacterium]MDD5664113.1 HD domain-containing protein [Victivallaceae bacterium]NLK83386.1 HD domain-containing protein [Lentisphaerota bacterium]